MTYSIVAADPAAGEVGCAVQSKYFAIGAVTPWVRAGIGAVATQAMGVVARNGERALGALAAQVDPTPSRRFPSGWWQRSKPVRLRVATAAGSRRPRS